MTQLLPQIGMSRIVSLIAVFCCCIYSTLPAQGVITIPMSPSHFAGWVPNQLVVQLDSLTTAGLDCATAARSGLTGIERLDRLAAQLSVTSLLPQFPGAKRRHYQGRIIDLGGWFKITFNTPMAVETVCDLYAALPGVLTAQPIGIHGVERVPNDGFFSQQWHLDQASDHDIDAPEAWDRHVGNPAIIVGMLDSGVRYYHKDLGGSDASYNSPLNSRGNMWINSAELNAGIPNGIDDDGNGYVDDWIGWDFVTNVTGGNMSGEDYLDPDNDPSDFNGHGTHCAGNVSAINNNGYATAAAAGGWGNGTLQVSANGTRVMALRIGYSQRVSGREYGFVRMDFAAQALYYAANNGARIVSCSWGSSNSGGIGAAADYFLAGGGLIFKAAGNDGNTTADYICGRPDANIISVAATDASDLKATFSNYGSWVDISAPGVDILSSYHDHDDPQVDYMAWMDGTSMATPITASVAALIWGANPELTADQVRLILFNNADNIDALNPAYAGLLGVGRVNAFQPLLDPSLPVELGSFTARLDSGAVILRWETFSEVDNLGFEIARAVGEEGSFRLIASYRDLPALQGMGNSNLGRVYHYRDEDIAPEVLYRYLLYDVDYAGQRTPHGPVTADLRPGGGSGLLRGEISGAHRLFANYPNPFNPVTRISYQLSRPAPVQVSIYNIQGMKILTLVNEWQEAGNYQLVWDGRDARGIPVSSGTYFCRLTAGDFCQSRKMLLLR